MTVRTNDPPAPSIGHCQAIGTNGATGAGLTVARGGARARTEGWASHADQSAKNDDAPSSSIFRYGAYVCLEIPKEAQRRLSVADVPLLAKQLAFTNEFAGRNGHPPRAIAFLKRTGAASGQISDPALSGADAIVHVAAPDAAPIDRFCTELARLLNPPTKLRVLRGVVRPTVYTGNAMHEFAYARQVVQQPGAAMPNAFLIPMNKTPEWWAKGWMERHTYVLPRYDASGQIVHEGHVLAAAAGIACIMRRTYKSASQPAPEESYEFLNYFECADTAVSILEAVVAALRDVRRNPEWAFVREGPMWQGRRVPEWRHLFA